MSTTARLMILDRPDLAPGARYFEVDCKHGTTRVLGVNVPGGFEMTDEMSIRMALLKHQDGEPHCRCIRRLWREHFGCEWPTVPLAAGEPGPERAS